MRDQPREFGSNAWSAFMPRFCSSLRPRLMLIVMIAVLPAMLLILHTGFEERKSAAALAQEKTKRLLELASAHQIRMIEEANRIFVSISEKHAALMEDPGQCGAYFAEVVKEHPRFLNLGLIGADGQLRCSGRPIEKTPDLSDRDYFQRSIKEGRLSIGSCGGEDATGETAIAFGYPVRDTAGAISSVLFASVDMDWLGELTARIPLPQGATLTMVDSGGTIIARYPEPDRWVGRVIPAADVFKTIMNERGEGLTEADGIDGVRRLYAFTPLDDDPHSTFLYTGIPIGTVYAQTNRALMRNLIALTAVSILALLAAHFFGNLFVMRWVNDLVRTARRIAAGDLGARTGIAWGNGELSQLGMAFDEMAQSLEARRAERDQMEEALRRSESRYRNLMEQIPVVAYTAALDDMRSTLFISPQIESLVGFDQEDFLTDPRAWSRMLHPDDREAVLAEAFRCREERDLFICEYRVFTFHGHIKWIRDEAVTVLNDAGEPFLIQGVLIDITEQKKAEEALREARDELEARVEKRTEELAGANDELRQGAEKLKLFAYSIVHDLKSPAIGAYGITKLLQRQYRNVLDDKARRYCNQIMRASEHIAELVDKINVYIATKETPVTVEPVHFADVMKVLREEFADKLERRRIRWVEPEADLVFNADRLSVLRVFRNFVDNALKYGGDQLSEIRIGCQERDDFHVFSVTDDGQGVNEKDAKRIFQAFQRNGGPGEVEGAGLGLAIVKEIADQHRGWVWMEPGKENGTAFYLSIAKDLERTIQHNRRNAA